MISSNEIKRKDHEKRKKLFLDSIQFFRYLFVKRGIMAVELIVTVKDDEKRLTKSHLIYDAITACEDDPTVAECVRETVKEFGNPESEKSVTVKIILSIE